MKNVIKRVGAFTMAAAVSVSLMGGALAYSTPDFADVPAANWAYESVMKMADAGVIKGTSGTTFAPEVKVSPAMWLTLVGRAVYEADVKAAAQAGDDWFTAYVRVAQSKGLTTGTNITDTNLQGEMTRYDMAATVYAAVKLLGVKDATVDTSTIKDYGDIPNKYTAAVGQMYATGLIKGDGAGNFNGTATMTRAEAATVMDRLITLRDTKSTEPETPEETIPPRTGETETVQIKGTTYSAGPGASDIPAPGANIKLCIKGGRVLGEGTADEKGKFDFAVTMDKADYSYTADQYYLEVRWTAPDGLKWSNIHTSSTPSTTKFIEQDGRDWRVEIYHDSRHDQDF